MLANFGRKYQLLTYLVARYNYISNKLKNYRSNNDDDDRYQTVASLGGWEQLGHLPQSNIYINLKSAHLKIMRSMLSWKISEWLS